MSTQNKSTLKNWFRKGLVPTQSQFADAFDSFFHKGEDMIPLSQVDGLLTEMGTQKSDLQDYVNYKLDEALRKLDASVNDNSDHTVSYISFGCVDNKLVMYLHMLNGTTMETSLGIPVATSAHDGLMSAEDKAALDVAVENLSKMIVDLHDYAKEGKRIPTFKAIFVYNDYVVNHVRYITCESADIEEGISEGDSSRQSYVVFCIENHAQADQSNVFLVYYDSGGYVTRYEKAGAPDVILRAFGEALATDTKPGMMSAEDKVALAKAVEAADVREVITITYWTFEPPNIVKDGVSKEGIYMYNYETKKLYVSYLDTDIYFREVALSAGVIYVRSDKNIPYIWNNGNMEAIAPEDVPASIFNATNEIPVRGYYVLCDPNNQSLSAVHAAWNADKAVSGLIISFESGASIWKTYQYIGKTVTEANWFDESNWKDFGSLAAGSESYVDINNLLDNTVVYSLSAALEALKNYMEKTNTDYRKQGMIVAYKSSEDNEVECKQYKGTTKADFWESGLWQDFGGGSNVQTQDTPAENGADAFSTGGAYQHIPVQINVDTETEGVVKLSMVNAGGDAVGDEVQFPVGTGSGGGAGTIIATAFKSNPLYGRAGGDFKIKAAIISTTQAGSMETTNSIQSVTFINRTTKKTVATFAPKKPSSASMTDYSFEFDISSICTTAGELSLQAVITDDGGNTATKNISVIAVDVTCESVQTLNYTKDTVLEVGGQAKSIPMFRFPNNASDKGIIAKIEMYKNGEWVTLATPTITDSYSHTVSIDPTGLAHGAHAIRIQGTDVSSGVTGNILHTAVMVLQQDETLDDYDTPVVVARWSDGTSGKKELFETLQLDVAVFKRSTTSPTVTVKMYNGASDTTGSTIAQQIMVRNTSYTVTKRLTGVSEGDTLTFRATCDTAVQPEDYIVEIDGTLLPIAETEGVVFNIDLSERSNSDIDKSISVARSDSGYATLDVQGSNYSSNGFVKDSYGTDTYGTANDTGRMSLRIAEDVTVGSNIAPYANTAIETNGSAFSLTTKVKNVADNSAELMSCKGDKMGFVLTGEKLVVYTNGDPTDAATSATIPYKTNMVHRFDIVVEPSAIAPYSGIGVIKIFKNGEEAGAVIYKAGAFPTTDATVSWSGCEADLYLYNVKLWNSYYNFVQAFDNYLVGLVDTDAMLSEYEANDVMVSQTVEGTTKDRPSMQKCLDAGLCVVVLTKNKDSEDMVKNYPDYLEGLDGDKKTTIQLDWYCYFPGREWQNCIVTNTPTSNQGTTSSWRKIKNKKSKFKKAQSVALMYTRQEISDMYGGDEEVLAKYDIAAAQAQKNKIQIKEGGKFTNIITMKVDYSDSTGAHNGSMMEQMNDMQIMLGNNYMTPAQVFNTDETEIHTSIDSIPCALFRTDHYMTAIEALDPANAYFHAKANFNSDKGDASFFGFEGVPGYSKSCVNYGDFTELVAGKDADFDTFIRETIANAPSTLKPGTLYMLSEYCGPKVAFIENDGTGSMTETTATEGPVETTKTLAEVLADAVKNYDRNTVYLTSDAHYVKYTGGTWLDTTGSMTHDSATNKWSITGRVLNPTECFEYLKYDSLNWSQGVNSVEDMMAIDDSTGCPKWLSYYESRYPDDDDLVEKYEAGTKVPYNLYQWLLFCQQCNQNLGESDGNVTVNGTVVAGTATNRTDKWRKELHKHANVYSTLCYTAASDYHACVDQRSKNMMIGFYLCTDGVMRAYFNHWYDGDCVDGSDNDCGLTIPWDMDARTSHLYQGWDNVIFQQTYAVDESDDRSFWLDDEGTSKITLSQVAHAMRKVERYNVKTFSAEGCYYYWVTQRISKWAKVVSSFDGERKYIQNSTASDPYFFALHGLRLDDLPDYQEKRFERCDGQFQVGDLYTNPFKARMMGDIEITITAAKDGFFGIGEDRADACADSCHLNAGESYTFTVGAAQESGKMIYLFGANKVKKLDISKCTPKLEAFSLEYCTLLEELVIGGASYSPAYTTGILSSLSLPAMPFLKKLDIRNTKIMSLTAANCPRLVEIYAEGSLLKTLSTTESAPITLLHLPSTMTTLSFTNLKKLKYPGGLSFEGTGSIRSVLVTQCDKIDCAQLLLDIIAGGASIRYISMTGINVSSQSSVLQKLIDSGATGLSSTGAAYDESSKCTGLTGRWIMTDFVSDETLTTMQTYFPELDIHNSQYCEVVFDDTVADPQNITNLDNNTGYDYSNEYKASAHVLQIWNDMKPVIGIYDHGSAKMNCIPLDESDYSKLADGRSLDSTYDKGEYDAFMYIGRYWYKGINDYKHDRKHLFYSSLQQKPLSSASVTKMVNLPDIMLMSGCSVCTDSTDTSICDDDGNIKVDSSTTFIRTNASYNAYRMDVEGMKQVRWPGVTSSRIGAVFVKEDGTVVDTYNLTGMSSDTDFMEGDFTFTTVPEEAKYFIFAVKVANANGELIAVDSSELEAIEPDWVEHKPELVGIYEAAMLNGTLRSVTGVAAKLGDGNGVTYTGWTYDSDGNVQNVDPVDIADLSLHYSYKDFQNLAWLRGKGYQMIDYETSKDVANIFYALVGNRDAQIVCGYGRGVGSSSSNGWTNNYKTGYWDSIGKANSTWNSGMGNKVLGIENFMACNCEWMDNVGVNIQSFASFKKSKMVGMSGDPTDSIWHIFDPLEQTERTVQGINASGYCIGRVRFGRYADIVPSKLTSDNSKWNQNYADAFWYSHGSGRVLYRAGSYASAYGGLAFANANYVSSNSSASFGTRLAFKGAIELKAS